MSKDFNINPYYDDHKDEKGFVRVMYKPSLAVQARELTQQQTILQRQISRFADHVFENGSRVSGGETFLNLKTTYLRLTNTLDGVPVDLQAFLYKEITGAISGARAKVVHVENSDGTNPPTLFLTMLTGDSEETTALFSASEQITTQDGSIAQVAASVYTGFGSLFSINEGVFYVDGFFVFLNKQTLVLERYSDTPTYRIGLTLREDIVTSNQDASLLDPARQSTNFQAIGADRYRIQLILDKKRLDFTDDVSNSASEKFVELMRLENGVKIKDNKYPIYSDLAKTLARRTADESGDYTVKPFQIRIEDHPTDATKLRIGLESGKAYIQGYEFETIAPEYIVVDKARQTHSEQNRDINAKYGNYCLVSGMKGFFDPTGMMLVDLLDTAISGVTDQTVYTAKKIGTAKLRMVTYDSGTSTMVYRFYLFGFAFNTGKSFANVRSIWGGTFASGIKADINSAGKTTGGDAILFENSLNYMLFKTPFSTVKTLKPNTNIDTDYITRRAFPSVSFSGGTASIAVSGTNTFFGGAGALTASLKRGHYIVVLTAVSNAGATGLAVGDVVDFTSGSRSITLSSGDQVASFNAQDGAFAATAKIIATVNLNVKPERTKTSVTQAITGLTLTSGTASLAKSDVYKIDSIIDTGAANADVTNKFVFDNGQRDTHYDHASITIKAGQTITGPLTVNCKYFTHSGSGYFSVDSYGIAYADIPTYTIQATGETVRLCDVLDFRPRRTDGNTTFAIDASGADIPVPETNINMDIEYYLDRADRIVLKTNFEFDSQSGTPSSNPTVPASDGKSMTLYNIGIPAYTFSASDVAVQYVDNSRSTMSDIRSGFKRIDRLEYYTSLSLMEKNTKELLVTDSTGAEVFKNGILVDPFKNHDLGDYTNVDYKASIDTTTESLRCQADTNYLTFNYDDAQSTNTSQINDGITIEFEEQAFVNQPLASKSISANPFSVAVWQGNMSIAPQTDEWVDTVTEPIVLDSSVMSGSDVANFPKLYYGAYGLLAGAITKDKNSKSFYQNYVFTQKNAISSFRVDSSQIGGSPVDKFLYDQIVNVAKNQTQLIAAATSDKIVDLNFIPFIRAQDINFVGVSLKPNTRVYAFFDGVAVSSKVTPQGGTLGSAMYTDANGRVQGVFSLPNSDALRFRTGQRIFKLTDSSSNSDDGATTISEATFHASGLIQTKTAAVTSTRPPTITRAAPADNRIITDPVSRDISGRADGIISYKDPLAQTFTVDNSIYPDGLYTSSVELFFKAKDQFLPVTVEIRPTVNGYPHSSMTIPFSQVTLNPSEVFLSDDASIPTKFTFKAPVYLESGDYALVVTTNTDNYTLFVGELGQTTISTNQRITSQPYSGALFKSQNASVWVPELDEDITFKMNRCVFDTGSTGTAVFELAIPANDINYDSFEIITDSILPPNTSMTLSYKKRDATSGTMDSTWTVFEANKICDLASRALLDNGGDSSMLIKLDMTTSNDAVSPLLDQERANLLVLTNLINNDATNEVNATNGNALAKYISRTVTLQDGLDAEGLRVYLNAELPSGSSIKVYTRVQAAADDSKFGDRPWVEMSRVGNASDISRTGEIIEMQFKNDVLAYDGYAIYKKFAVKIVMLSPSTTVIPKVRDMRAIAITAG